jgi:hypothetical protein
MVMELLGPNIKQMMMMNNNKISLKSVIKIS